MTTFRPLAGALAALFLTATLGLPAAAAPRADVAAPERAFPVAADCYAIGEAVAAQNGGQLTKATAQQRGGQTVCVIVVLVPAQDGKRPRRAEFVVPAN